jgi:hypothetical protein
VAWFRRRADSGSDGPEADAPDDDGDVIRQERSPVGDWMTMAPLAPTFGAMAPSFRVQTLAEIMPSHQSPRLSGEMGHSVSASAPSGLVDGLAVSTGAVAATGGHGDLPLRERHHEPAEAPVAAAGPSLSSSPSMSSSPSVSSSPSMPLAEAMPARPLAAVTEPEALPVSRLPQPGVSRTLSDPMPLAAPSLPSPAAPLASSSDSRVGGFAATLENDDDGGGDGGDLTNGAGDHTELFTPQPDELAPPILPRVRRGGAQELPVMPTIGSAPLEVEAAEPIGSATEPVREAIGPGVGSLPLPLPPVASSPGALTPPAPAAVQRHADHGPTSSSSTPSAVAPDAEAEAEPDAADEAALAPVQRRADEPTSPSSTPPARPPAPEPEAEPEAEAADEAPLVGSPSPSLAANPNEPDHAPEPEPEPRPLVQRRLDSPTPASPAAPTLEPALGLPLPVAPSTPAVQRVDMPLTGASPSPTSLGSANTPSRTGPSQTTEAPAPTAPSLDLPLAGGPPPAPSVAATSEPTSTAPATEAAPTPEADAPLLGDGARPGVGTPSDDGPVDGTTGATTGGGAAAAEPLGLPLVESSASSPTSSPAPSAPAEDIGSAPLLSVAPLLGEASPPPAPTPLVGDYGEGRRSAPPVTLPLALSRLADGTAPLPPPHTAPQPSPPLAVSRMAAGNAATPNAPLPMARPEMPLHTPAASIPSAAEIVVSAGLAERGPNGTLLYANPPATAESNGEAVQREFSIQRVEDEATAPANDHQTSAAGTNGIFVSRLAPDGESSAAPIEGQGGDTLLDDVHKLADQARKLYPHIRTQLESDIRRQLEARNRAGRYRP